MRRRKREPDQEPPVATRAAQASRARQRGENQNRVFKLSETRTGSPGTAKLE